MPTAMNEVGWMQLRTELALLIFWLNESYDRLLVLEREVEKLEGYDPDREQVAA